jgi:hypothetical protein
MKLEYKVLWFEDQFEYIEETIEEIAGLVRDSGFMPDIEKRTGITSAEIEELSKRLESYNPYDLIIFDHDLGGASEDGLYIANKLRNTIYTDMIFYSGKVPGELRKLLYENKVDGVFVIHRENFYDEVKPLIEDHIKRMSDINNMRGVIMSGTSVLDVRIRQLLVEKIEAFDAVQMKEILERIKRKLEESIAKKSKIIKEFDCPINAVNDHNVTHFDLVRVLLKSQFKKGSEQYIALNDGAAIHKVQIERNNLAHQRDEYTDDGRMLLHGRKESVVYDFDEFKRLRNELLAALESI